MPASVVYPLSRPISSVGNRKKRPHFPCVEINPDYISVGKNILPEATWIQADVFRSSAGHWLFQLCYFQSAFRGDPQRHATPAEISNIGGSTSPATLPIMAHSSSLRTQPLLRIAEPNTSSAETVRICPGAKSGSGFTSRPRSIWTSVLA